jgi:hypothetical protein
MKDESRRRGQTCQIKEKILENQKTDAFSEAGFNLEVSQADTIFSPSAISCPAAFLQRFSFRCTRNAFLP